jgi:uncharacterized protein (TIGR03437 family)
MNYGEYSMRSRIPKLLGALLIFSPFVIAQTPAINPGGVVSAAGLGGSTSIAPGSLISIFGTNLSSGLSVASSATLSTSLGDVNSVTINGVPIPLQFVSGSQINAQAPWETIAGPANVMVTVGGAASQPVTAQVSTFSPAIFAFQGTPQAIAVNADGSVTAPVGAITGVTSHPAMAGDSIFFYASGLGPVDPSPPPDGAPSLDALRQTTNPLTVLVGGVSAQVAFSGLAPQFTGVYQVNIVVPTGAAGPAVAMQLMIGGVTSPDALTIAMQ